MDSRANPDQIDLIATQLRAITAYIVAGNMQPSSSRFWPVMTPVCAPHRKPGFAPLRSPAGRDLSADRHPALPAQIHSRAAFTTCEPIRDHLFIWPPPSCSPFPQSHPDRAGDGEPVPLDDNEVQETDRAR